ncbi:MAG: hypothetical protein AAGG01_08200 [Planctomycetota bacterium]
MSHFKSTPLPPRDHAGRDWTLFFLMLPLLSGVVGATVSAVVKTIPAASSPR